MLWSRQACFDPNRETELQGVPGRHLGKLTSAGRHAGETPKNLSWR